MSRFVLRSLCATVLGMVLMLTAVATAPPAYAADGYFDFVKNSDNSLNNTLRWRTDATIYESWRSGSGITQNPCEINKGWLPNGWYHQNKMEHNRDSVIKGRAWDIYDKQCSNGTWRTALFIHTNEHANQTASCVTTNGMRRCFDSNQSYASNGCIKLARNGHGFGNHIHFAHNRYHNTSQGGTSTHGGML